MIEEYWNEVFGQYKTHSGKFEIPGFPEPLMSAHFGVTNLIGSHGSGQNFWLCEFDAINSSDLKISFEKLNDVGIDFWIFHSNCNLSALPFLQRLIPFLSDLETPHFHLFMKDEKGISVSAIAGESKCGVFVFNLFVRQDKRGQGLAKLMTNQVRSLFADKKCFYWTIHRGFFFNSRVCEYSLDQGLFQT